MISLSWWLNVTQTTNTIDCGRLSKQFFTWRSNHSNIESWRSFWYRWKCTQSRQCQLHFSKTSFQILPKVGKSFCWCISRKQLYLSNILSSKWVWVWNKSTQNFYVLFNNHYHRISILFIMFIVSSFLVLSITYICSNIFVNTFDTIRWPKEYKIIGWMVS